MRKGSVRKRVHWPELGSCIFFLAIAAGLVVFSKDLEMTFEGAPGPRFVPIVLAVLIAVLSIIYYVEILANPEKRVQFPGFKKLRKPSAFVGISFLIVLFWEPLGAAVTVFLVGMLELRFLEKMTWRRSIMTALIFSVLTWTLFQYVLSIQLPPGLLSLF